MNLQKLRRRDACHLVGTRGGELNIGQSAAAWRYFCGFVQGMGTVDSAYLPKFQDLLQAARQATIEGAKFHKADYENDELLAYLKTVPQPDQDRDEAAWLALPQSRRSGDGCPQGDGTQEGRENKTVPPD